MTRSQELTLKRNKLTGEINELNAIDDPSDEQRSRMGTLPDELKNLDSQLKVAFVAEAEERQANAPTDKAAEEKKDLIRSFEVNQVVMALSGEGGRLTAQTAELVEELRSHGTYEGIPVPFEALAEPMEIRADTVSGGTPNPVQTAPIIDRIFPGSVADRMGIRSVNIGFGEREYPIATSGATFGHASAEGSDIPAATVFATNDVNVSPNQTAGCRIDLSRKSIKQTGAGLEQAVRRDMRQTIAAGLDNVLFLGDGTGGAVTGILNTPSLPTTAIDAAADYDSFLPAAVQFMVDNAIASPDEVRILLRPEVFGNMDANASIVAGTDRTQWDRLRARFSQIVTNSNALAAPTGAPAESTGLLSVVTNGVPPAWLALYGSVDMVRDPFSRAASGTVQLTGLITYDLAVSRLIQLRSLTGLQ